MVKQINYRVKGTEKFWSEPSAEAILQLRADFLGLTPRPLPGIPSPAGRQRQATGRTPLSPVKSLTGSTSPAAPECGPTGVQLNRDIKYSRFTKAPLVPSPFPGMDPYLEDPSVSMDFHERFITYCSDALNDRLPDAYETRIEERVNLVALPKGQIHSYRADVANSQFSDYQTGNTGRTQTGTATTALAVEPVTIPFVFYEEEHAAKVHIIDQARIINSWRDRYRIAFLRRTNAA